MSAAVARAQTVAIARTAGDQRIANRINAELTALGYQVVVIANAPNSELASLPKLAAARGAIAGMRAAPSKTGIELWIAKPGSQATAFEEVVTVHSGRNDELLALRAVEVLRARLLKLGVHQAPIEASQPTARDDFVEPTPSPIAQTEPLPLLWTRLGVAYSYAHDNLSNHESVLLGLGLSPSARGSVTAFALLPLNRAEVSSDLGTAKARPMLFALAVGAHLSQGPLRLLAGAGVGTALLDIEGEAQPPYQGRQERLVSGVGFVRAGAGALLTPELALHLELMAGLARPNTVIRIGQSEAAGWGNPLLIGSLTLELGVLTLRR